MSEVLAAPALLDSARRLAAALAVLDARGQAAALLARVAADMGPGCFPLFIKLFCIVGESRDQAAKRQLARAMGDLLRAGATPAGPLNGWGEADAPDFTRGLFGAMGRRKLDPVAYLCAWYSQTTDRPQLDAATFERALTQCLAVIAADPQACALYRDKLLNDAATLPDGSVNEATRSRLRALALAWGVGLAPARVATLVLHPDRSPVPFEVVQQAIADAGVAP